MDNLTNKSKPKKGEGENNDTDNNNGLDMLRDKVLVVRLERELMGTRQCASAEARIADGLFQRRSQRGRVPAAVREAVSLMSSRMDARLESLSDRLLPEPQVRPPLASDKRRDNAAPAITSAGPSREKERRNGSTPAVTKLMPPANPGPGVNKKKKRRLLLLLKRRVKDAIHRKSQRHRINLLTRVRQRWSKGRPRRGLQKEIVGRPQRRRKRGTKAPFPQVRGRSPYPTARGRRARNNVQGNLNHCAQAQDLMVLSMAQWSIDITIVSEPYRVLPKSDRVGDCDSVVCLVLGSNMPPSSPPGSTTRSHGFVATNIGALTVAGVCFSPNRPLVAFEAFLLRLTALIGDGVRRSRTGKSRF
ncbi:reverse transcrpitase [Danaus plexippus plexippus]|uniref:Reverse transcrpitase n=1 Tax=Danaus plexippus plexippus TaxID=278856 RepID=A0A212F570_DANPL|nr:uncharacterized protein LOC116775453 [Danaus plexippus plexippus]OWR48873.1 reverse transcrpitase [Danaus plexippus plexippus]